MALNLVQMFCRPKVDIEKHICTLQWIIDDDCVVHCIWSNSKGALTDFYLFFNEGEYPYDDFMKTMDRKHGESLGFVCSMSYELGYYQNELFAYFEYKHGILSWSFEDAHAIDYNDQLITTREEMYKFTDIARAVREHIQ
jgi:hypothetical protein